MKIFYISHLKEESGYGRFCRSFLKSLKTTKHEISSYSLNLNKTINFNDETERVSPCGSDVVIQNVLPNHMVKSSQYCIGGAILESKDIEQNHWYQHLDFMDEVWYPHYTLNKFNKEREIPTALDLDKYTKQYDKLSHKDLEGTYKFYWIGEISKRKNLFGIIKAYFNAFNYSDPVSLIIKCHKSNFDQEQCQYEINSLIKTVIHGCKLYDNPEDYPKIKIISDFWPSDKILSLHQYGDCFVCGSYGESICYPMLDAIGFNNSVLSTNNFASESYSKYGKINISFSDETELCFGQVETFPWYQTSRESWPSFNMQDFSRQMLNIYNSRTVNDNDLGSLSYKNVGKKIEESLELL